VPGRAARPHRTGLVLAALTAGLVALAQGLPTVSVTRGDRLIVVEQRATGAEGARTVLANRNCEPGVLTNLFYGPVPGFVVTRVDETTLVSQFARVRVPAPSAGDEAEDTAGEASADDETIELLGGTATFDRPGCLETLDPEGALPVELRQGRTTVTGTRFFLDRGTDLASMDGPVVLTRSAADDGPPLEATAEALTFDVGTESATLTGEVVVTSGDRVSRAERLELDEEAGVALLTGSPATSRRGTDEVRGTTLRYDLETDDVIVVGSVSASFEVDLGEDETRAVVEDEGAPDPP
jgi:hypothetical protein